MSTKLQREAAQVALESAYSLPFLMRERYAHLQDMGTGFAEAYKELVEYSVEHNPDMPLPDLAFMVLQDVLNDILLAFSSYEDEGEDEDDE